MKHLSKFKFKLLLLSLILFITNFSFIVLAQANYPSPTNYKYVNDYADILTQEEKENIISLGKELEDKTGAQAVTVIIDTTNGEDISSYALNLFRTWGIGQKDKNNGLLLLVAIEDRKWRVEVGRGLEGALPDALTNRVMQSLAKDNFSNGDYGLGIINSYSVFCDYIAKEYNFTLEKSLNVTLPEEYYPNSLYYEEDYPNPLPYILIFSITLIIAVIIIIKSITKKPSNKSTPYRKHRNNSYNNFIWFNDFSNDNTSSSSDFDFGDFGGGDSGGGGSSGDW